MAKGTILTCVSLAILTAPILNGLIILWDPDTKKPIKVFTNQKTGAKYYKKQVNNVAIVWFFAPFFWDKIEQYKLQNYFEDIKPTWNITLASYLDYIKKLSKMHHDNIPVDKNSLLNLLSYIIMEFGLSNNSLTDQSQVLIQIKQDLKNN